MTSLPVRARPWWRRVLRAPRTWVQFYRLMRRREGPCRAAWVAWACTWCLVRGRKD